MKRVLSGMLLPIKAILILLLPIIRIALVPLKIIIVVCKAALGLGLMTVLFFKEPLGGYLSDAWLILAIMLVCYVIVLIPEIVAEMI